MATKDARIKKLIVDQLYWDDRVDVSNVTIEVSGGRVSLKGTVPNYTAKQSAEAGAMLLEEITSVDNFLTVQPAPDLPGPSDSEIRSNIVSLLCWKSSIEDSGIDVSVEKGVVTLAGTVVTYWQKVLAQNETNAAGVRDIVNKLAVVPSKKITDEAIAEYIVRAIDRNGLLNAEAITVSVEEGRVMLSGTVQNRAAFGAACDAAKYTAGVVDVNCAGLIISADDGV